MLIIGLPGCVKIGMENKYSKYYGLYRYFNILYCILHF